MVFFAKDKTSARKRMREIGKREGIVYSDPKLAKKQIPHINGWKTWTTREIRKRKKK